jgi:hypothetical protein
MEVVQSTGAPSDAGFRELRLQEVEKQSCMIDRGLGGLVKRRHACPCFTLA